MYSNCKYTITGKFQCKRNIIENFNAKRGKECPKGTRKTRCKEVCIEKPFGGSRGSKICPKKLICECEKIPYFDVKIFNLNNLSDIQIEYDKWLKKPDISKKLEYTKKYDANIRLLRQGGYDVEKQINFKFDYDKSYYSDKNIDQFNQYNTVQLFYDDGLTNNVKKNLKNNEIIDLTDFKSRIHGIWVPKNIFVVLYKKDNQTYKPFTVIEGGKDGRAINFYHNNFFTTNMEMKNLLDGIQIFPFFDCDLYSFLKNYVYDKVSFKGNLNNEKKTQDNKVLKLIYSDNNIKKINETYTRLQNIYSKENNESKEKINHYTYEENINNIDKSYYGFIVPKNHTLVVYHKTNVESISGYRNKIIAFIIDGNSKSKGFVDLRTFNMTGKDIGDFQLFKNNYFNKTFDKFLIDVTKYLTKGKCRPNSYSNSISKEKLLDKAIEYFKPENNVFNSFDLQYPIYFFKNVLKNDYIYKKFNDADADIKKDWFKQLSENEFIDNRIQEEGYLTARFDNEGWEEGVKDWIYSFTKTPEDIKKTITFEDNKK